MHVVPFRSKLHQRHHLGAGISCPSILLMGLTAFEPGPACVGEAVNEKATVVVTANRVAENAQNVPTSISVVNAAVADQPGITDAQSLAAGVPGPYFNREANIGIPYARCGLRAVEAGDDFRRTLGR